MSSVFIFLICISNQFIINHGEHQIKKRGVVETLVFAAKATSELKTSYANADLSNEDDVAINVIEAIPIVGDIVIILTKNPDEIDSVKRYLKTIRENMNNFSKILDNFEIKVDQLSKEINLSILKSQVADANIRISSCYKDFLLLLKDPTSVPEQERVKNCYSKFYFVRLIGRLLTNETITFTHKGLFNQIIDLNGYCDGRELNDVFQYLLGVYVEGCTALMTSEILKYDHTSNTYKDECEETLRKVQTTHTNIYETCRNEKCENVVPIMRKILSNPNGTDVISEFHQVYPWFYPFLVIFNSDNPNVQFDNGNRIIIKDNGQIARVFMWSSYQFGTSYGNLCGLEFSVSALYFLQNEIGFVEHQSLLRSSFTGFCKNHQQTDCVDYDAISEPKDKIQWGYLALSVCVIIFVLLVIEGSRRAWKKMCN